MLLSLSQLQELDDNLAALTEEFETATAAKLKCQQQAEATANTISLANRYTQDELYNSLVNKSDREKDIQVESGTSA